MLKQPGFTLIATLALAAPLVSLLFAQSRESARSRILAFTHVTVIGADAAKPDFTLVIAGDRIVELGPHQRVLIPVDAQVIDASGKFLIPGLWDMHAHFGAPLCYPGFSLHDELESLVRHVGLTPAEALQSATRIPAEFMGMGASLGAVEQGKLADLVLLEANPLSDITNTRKIAAVVIGGRLFDKAQLQTMLDKMAAEAAER